VLSAVCTVENELDGVDDSDHVTKLNANDIIL